MLDSLPRKFVSDGCIYVIYSMFCFMLCEVIVLWIAFDRKGL